MKTIEHGHRVMVRTGHLENDTMAFVGMRGTVVAIYSNDPNGKDRHESVIAIKLDCRSHYDSPILFRAADLAMSNPGNRTNKKGRK